jgi:hypothetical protein
MRLEDLGADEFQRLGLTAVAVVMAVAPFSSNPARADGIGISRKVGPAAFVEGSIGARIYLF